jgi:hypothetical protein
MSDEITNRNSALPIAQDRFFEEVAGCSVVEERGVEYRYDSYVDAEGREVGFISYHTGRAPEYYLTPTEG